MCIHLVLYIRMRGRFKKLIINVEYIDFCGEIIKCHTLLQYSNFINQVHSSNDY